MVVPTELHTPRLILRHWRDEDLASFAALNADPEVMRFFPACLDTQQSDALVERVRQHLAVHGFGWWVLQQRETGAFIGAAGLLHVGFNAPFVPAVEIGWRLARQHWRQGYAREAASAALASGFEHLKLEEIVSFTVVDNLPSQGVMQAIGMRRDRAGDFEHPALAEGHPLRRHVLYRLARREWEAAR